MPLGITIPGIVSETPERLLTEFEEAAYTILTVPKYSDKWHEADGVLSTLDPEEANCLMIWARLQKKNIRQIA